jgi:nucleotide-binding universal stress UspA family protein
MFRQILVPTDFSQKHINPLEIATNLAEKYISTIHLFHVIEIIPDAAFTEFEDFYKKLEKRAQKQMNTLVSNYQGKSVQILPHISYGNRVQEILKFIKQYEIDLIIMNSHKAELNNPIQDWGTISYRVALLSESPVMLVK